MPLKSKGKVKGTSSGPPSSEILKFIRISTEFQKLGLRGVTVLAATGDGGSHFSFMPFDSSDPIGAALNAISCNYIIPTFPGTAKLLFLVDSEASSPYVIGVGGTAVSILCVLMLLLENYVGF